MKYRMLSRTVERLIHRHVRACAKVEGSVWLRAGPCNRPPSALKLQQLEYISMVQFKKLFAIETLWGHDQLPVICII